jgi:DNA-directed RNA polymerase subunit omega
MLTEPDVQGILYAPGRSLGNRFSLITLVRKRAQNLVDGSPPLVETDSRNHVSIALEEIHQGKVRSRLPGSTQQPVDEKVEGSLDLQAKALALALGT